MSCAFFLPTLSRSMSPFYLCLSIYLLNKSATILTLSFSFSLSLSLSVFHLLLLFLSIFLLNTSFVFSVYYLALFYPFPAASFLHISFVSVFNLILESSTIFFLFCLFLQILFQPSHTRQDVSPDS